MKLFIGLFVASSVVRAACVSDPGGTVGCPGFTAVLTVQDRMSQAEQTFNPNEPITFAMSITNTRNAPATLAAGSSCTAIVFEVNDSTGRRQWGSSDNAACIGAEQRRVYEPLEAVTESNTWDQRSSGGGLVSPGNFVVTATVEQFMESDDGMLDCRADLSQSSAFAIR